MSSAVLGRSAIDQLEISKSRGLLNVAERVADVISIKLYRFLLKNMWSKLVHKPKRMTVVYVADSAALVTATELALLKTDLDIIDAVPYKPAEGKTAI